MPRPTCMGTIQPVWSPYNGRGATALSINNKATGPLSWRSGPVARPTSTFTKRQALMANRTDQPQGQPSPDDDSRWDRRALTPQPNRILATPDTPQQCATELRTPAERTTAAGAARNQFAYTRMAARGGN